MFHSCTAFHSDVSRWDVRNATRLSYMFTSMKMNGCCHRFSHRPALVSRTSMQKNTVGGDTLFYYCVAVLLRAVSPSSWRRRTTTCCCSLGHYVCSAVCYYYGRGRCVGWDYYAAIQTTSKTHLPPRAYCTVALSFPTRHTFLVGFGETRNSTRRKFGPVIMFTQHLRYLAPLAGACSSLLVLHQW